MWLRRRGATVTLVEAVERPDSVVGESLLPGVGPVLEDLGVDMSGHLVKRGAVFCRGDRAARFDFADAHEPRYAYAWQVQREVFDQQLRARATEAGCRVVYATALRAELPGLLHTTEGALQADLIVDAGGRAMWLSRQLGLREPDPHLKNAAIATRVRGARWLEGDQEGDIVICEIPGGWIWIIPFQDGTSSVGVVTTPGSPLRGDPEQRLKGALALSAAARARLSEAERILPFRGLSDWTASSTRFFGDGFALCGDAATFLDPIFSTGVLLGLDSARGLAAALDGGDLADWEARYREGLGVFRGVVDCWYTGDFMDLALAPPAIQRSYVKVGITTVLAGDVFRGPAVARSVSERMPFLAEAVRRYAAGHA